MTIGLLGTLWFCRRQFVARSVKVRIGTRNPALLVLPHALRIAVNLIARQVGGSARAARNQSEHRDEHGNNEESGLDEVVGSVRHAFFSSFLSLVCLPRLGRRGAGIAPERRRGYVEPSGAQARATVMEVSGEAVGEPFLFGLDSAARLA
jgi:hypothetical protein